MFQPPFLLWDVPSKGEGSAHASPLLKLGEGLGVRETKNVEDGQGVRAGNPPNFEKPCKSA